tara:strand:+ start:208 stop:393 length:186 start_codon:yes stop_codon:yes gene_type:complete
MDLITDVVFSFGAVGTVTLIGGEDLLNLNRISKLKFSSLVGLNDQSRKKREKDYLIEVNHG